MYLNFMRVVSPQNGTKSLQNSPNLINMVTAVIIENYISDKIHNKFGKIYLLIT